jgi:hypothetical protein
MHIYTHRRSYTLAAANFVDNSGKDLAGGFIGVQGICSIGKWSTEDGHESVAEGFVNDV